MEELRRTFEQDTQDRGFDLVVDGLLGMQGRPGLQTPMKEWIHLLNQSEKIAVRISVDLPSGVTEEASHEARCISGGFYLLYRYSKKSSYLRLQPRIYWKA